jgi:hypothetical protein
LELDAGGGARGGVVFASTASTTMGLGAMAQQGLGGLCVLIDRHWAAAMSGVVVASMAGSTKFMRIFTLKISRRFDGGDGFCSMCMRYLLRVC